MRLQGLIQACGAFHLLGAGRREPAERMARAALEKLSSTAEASSAWVEIPGLEPVLEALAAGGTDALARAGALRASVTVRQG